MYPKKGSWRGTEEPKLIGKMEKKKISRLNLNHINNYIKYKLALKRQSLLDLLESQDSNLSDLQQKYLMYKHR